MATKASMFKLFAQALTHSCFVTIAFQLFYLNTQSIAYLNAISVNDTTSTYYYPTTTNLLLTSATSRRRDEGGGGGGGAASSHHYNYQLFLLSSSTLTNTTTTTITTYPSSLSPISLAKIPNATTSVNKMRRQQQQQQRSSQDVVSHNLLTEANETNDNCTSQENCHAAKATTTVSASRIWRITIICVVCVVIFASTIVGNLLVILAVIIVKKLHTEDNASNYLIVSLAVSDLLVGVCVMPFALYAEINDQLWELGNILCDFYTMSDVLLCTASILNLCAISIDRYFIILHSMKYTQRRNAKLMFLMILIVWVLSSAISLPPLFGWGKPSANLQKDKACMVSTDLMYQIYATSFAFYIPLVVMIIIYMKIYFTARKIKRREMETAGRLTSLGHCHMASLSHSPESVQNFRTQLEPLLEGGSDAASSSPTKKKKSSSSGDERSFKLFRKRVRKSTANSDLSQQQQQQPVQAHQQQMRASDATSASQYVAAAAAAAAGTAGEQPGTPTTPRAGGGGGGSPHPSLLGVTGSGGAASSLVGLNSIHASSDPAHLHHGAQAQNRRASGVGGASVKKVLSRRLTYVFSQINKRPSAGSLARGKNQKATQTLGIIMGCFTLCWLPFFILAIVKSLPYKDGQVRRFIPGWIDSFLLWLGYFNSAINPVIYARFNREFRRPFLEILCFRCRGINEKLRELERRKMQNDSRHQYMTSSSHFLLSGGGATGGAGVMRTGTLRGSTHSNPSSNLAAPPPPPPLPANRERQEDIQMIDADEHLPVGDNTVTSAASSSSSPTPPSPPPHPPIFKAMPEDDEIAVTKSADETTTTTKQSNQLTTDNNNNNNNTAQGEQQFLDKNDDTQNTNIRNDPESLYDLASTTAESRYASAQSVNSNLFRQVNGHLVRLLPSSASSASRLRLTNSRSFSSAITAAKKAMTSTSQLSDACSFVTVPQEPSSCYSFQTATSQSQASSFYSLDEEFVVMSSSKRRPSLLREVDDEDDDSAVLMAALVESTMTLKQESAAAQAEKPPLVPRSFTAKDIIPSSSYRPNVAQLKLAYRRSSNKKRGSERTRSQHNVLPLTQTRVQQQRYKKVLSQSYPGELFPTTVKRSLTSSLSKSTRKDLPITTNNTGTILSETTV